MSDVIIHTSKGDIAFDFFDHCPDAVGNFEDLVAESAYDGDIFHEVIKDFIIQAGDLTKSGGTAEDPDDYLLDEYSHDVMFDRPYLVACVGRGDFSHPTQFFITLRPAEHLDWHHTIFGEVIDEQSQEVVREINAVGRDETVTINSIEILEQS